MIAAGTFGILCGVLLARRFKVFVLVPVEALALLGTGLAVLAGRIPGGEAALGVLAFSAGLQLSFIAAGMLLGQPQPQSHRTPRRA